MSLSGATIAHIRRHLGYPKVGLPQSIPGRPGAALAVGLAGYRTDDSYNSLEEALARLRPEEEAILTGLAYGAIGISSNVTPGDSIEVTIDSDDLEDPEVFSVVVQTGDTVTSFLTRIATAVNQRPVLAQKRFQAKSPWGTGKEANMIYPNPEMAIICPTAFMLTILCTGNIGAAVSAWGGIEEPSIPIDDGEGRIYGWLPICNYLHSAIGGAADNQGFRKAEVTFNAREPEERERLYKKYVKWMADFLGVELFPTRTSGVTSSFNL